MRCLSMYITKDGPVPERRMDPEGELVAIHINVAVDMLTNTPAVFTFVLSRRYRSRRVHCLFVGESDCRHVYMRGVGRSSGGRDCAAYSVIEALRNAGVVVNVRNDDCAGRLPSVTDIMREFMYTIGYSEFTTITV